MAGAACFRFHLSMDTNCSHPPPTCRTHPSHPASHPPSHRLTQAALTDLHDCWVENALEGWAARAGQLVRCRVLGKGDEKGHLALSLRPAAVAGGPAPAGDAPPESLSAEELKPGQQVRWRAAGRPPQQRNYPAARSAALHACGPASNSSTTGQLCQPTSFHSP